MSENHETVGHAATRLLSTGDQKQGVVDTQREMTKGYIDELVKCAKDGVQHYGNAKPFYICVQTRRERLLTNVIRNQFYHRQSRPWPAYDLALYWYNPKDEQLCFVWCIPDKETCVEIGEQSQSIKGQEQLFTFVKLFLAGILI